MSPYACFGQGKGRNGNRRSQDMQSGIVTFTNRLQELLDIHQATSPDTILDYDRLPYTIDFTNCDQITDRGLEFLKGVHTIKVHTIKLEDDFYLYQ